MPLRVMMPFPSRTDGRKTVGLWLCVVLALALGAPGRARLPEALEEAALKGRAEAGRVLRVRGDRDYKPFEFINDKGEPDGFNVEIMRAVARTMGLDIEINLGPWSEIRSELERGEIDLLMGMYRTNERDKHVDFSIPLFIVSYAVFVHKDSDIHAIEDARDKVILVQEGDLGYDFVTENRLGRRVVASPDLSDSLRALSVGKGDCAVLSRLQGLLYINQYGLKDIVAVGPPIIQRKYCIAVREGDASLLAEINEGLSILKASGEFERIHHKWFGLLEREFLTIRQSAKYLGWTLAPLLALTAVAFLWSWSLRSQVRARTVALELELAERKRAQASLRDSEERFRGMVANIPGVIYHCENDEHWTMRYISDAIEEITDYPASDFIDNRVRSYASIIHPGDRAAVDRDIQAKVTGREIYNLEYRILDARGEAHWVHERGQGVMGESQEVRYLSGAIFDVTERKKTENALKESETKYRTLFEVLSEGVFLLAEGRIVDCNEQTCRLFGFAREELLGRTPGELSPDLQYDGRRSEEEAQRRIAEAMAGKEQHFEWLHKRNNGPLIDTDVSLRSLLLNDREVVQAVVRDISARKSAERELRRLRNLLSNIVNSMPSVLVGVDLDGTVMQWNAEAEKATGIGAQDAQGRKLEDVFPQLASEMEKVHEAIDRRRPLKEQKVVSADRGAARYVDVTVYPLVTDGVEGAVIRVDDVTDRVRIEEMMIQSEKMLSVGGLAAGMAHEINNPLAGILQNVQVIRNRISKDIPRNESAAQACGTTLDALRAYMEERRIPEMIEAILESGKRAARIVQNMLNFSRKSGSLFSSHDIAALLDNTVELASNDYDLKKKFDFRKIEIVREYDANLPLVPCEGGEIQQVFLNILNNGAYAMVQRDDADGAGREEAPRFILRTAREATMARIEIEDNGPGMEPEIRRRVFEPFFTTKGVGVGTGLGLSVSYFIVTKNHRGTMRVESRVGRGSNFIMRLPLERREL